MKRRIAQIEAEVSKREEAAKVARGQQAYELAKRMPVEEVDALMQRYREASTPREFLENLTDAELTAICIRLDGDKDVQWYDITDEDLDRLTSEEITNDEMDAILSKYRIGGHDK